MDAHISKLVLKMVESPLLRKALYSAKRNQIVFEGKMYTISRVTSEDDNKNKSK